jgi:hypothetical protein
MAPEFIPFIVCGLLIIASAATCGTIAVAFLARGVLRRSIERRFPRVARLSRPLLLLAVVPTVGLLLLTGACAYMVRQQFFLNEPMAIAAAEGKLEEVRSLLDRGASPDSWGVDYIEPAIVGAARGGHAPVVRLLLARGANPNARNSNGTSALAGARDSGNSEVVQLLTKAGARD